MCRATVPPTVTDDELQNCVALTLGAVTDFFIDKGVPPAIAQITCRVFDYCCRNRDVTEEDLCKLVREAYAEFDHVPALTPKTGA